jgi:hypothetical protein
MERVGAKAFLRAHSERNDKGKKVHIFIVWDMAEYSS